MLISCNEVEYITQSKNENICNGKNQSIQFLLTFYYVMHYHPIDSRCKSPPQTIQPISNQESHFS